MGALSAILSMIEKEGCTEKKTSRSLKYVSEQSTVKNVPDRGYRKYKILEMVCTKC